MRPLASVALSALMACGLAMPASSAVYGIMPVTFACEASDPVEEACRTPTVTLSGTITTTGKLGDLDLDQILGIFLLGVDGEGVELFKSAWEPSDGPSPFVVDGDPEKVRLHASATALTLIFAPQAQADTAVGLDKSFGKIRISQGSTAQGVILTRLVYDLTGEDDFDALVAEL